MSRWIWKRWILLSLESLPPLHSYFMSSNATHKCKSGWPDFLSLQSDRAIIKINENFKNLIWMLRFRSKSLPSVALWRMEIFDIVSTHFPPLLRTIIWREAEEKMRRPKSYDAIFVRGYSWQHPWTKLDCAYMLLLKCIWLTMVLAHEQKVFLGYDLNMYNCTLYTEQKVFHRYDLNMYNCTFTSSFAVHLQSHVKISLGTKP